MKFVTKTYGNETDVNLHWETKEQLKKIACFVLFVPATAIAVVRYVQQHTDHLDNK